MCTNANLHGSALSEVLNDEFTPAIEAVTEVIKNMDGDICPQMLANIKGDVRAFSVTLLHLVMIAEHLRREEDDLNTIFMQVVPLNFRDDVAEYHNITMGA